MHCKDLNFHTSAFGTTYVGTIPLPCTKHNCGLEVQDDSVLHRAYVTSVAPYSSASKLHQDIKTTLKRIRGAYVIKINNDPVFSSADVKAKIKKYQDQGGCISITFGLEPKLTTKQLKQAYTDFNLFLPAASKGNRPHSSKRVSSKNTETECYETIL